MSFLVLCGVLMLTVVAGPASAGSPVGNQQVLEVRFKASSTVRGTDSDLSASTDQTLDEIKSLMEEIEASAFEPLASGVPQIEAARIATEARKTSGSASPNMANWYRVAVPASRSIRALKTLRDSALVDFAGTAPEALPPPVTPDFSPFQIHLDLAPTGIGARESLVDSRTRGAGVKIVDLEYYWTRQHEDLQLPPETDIGAPDYVQYTAFDDEHGTAVFGILGARDNGIGVTGIVPEATLKGISPQHWQDGHNPAGALTYLATMLQAGDVVLIEQQADGPAPESDDFLPLEWNQASFDVIKQLTNLGVIVVETGGNGGYNLDSPAMLGRFDRSVRDSGAILVGAGDAVTKEPLWYSSHGGRMDLQGHGNGIVTTGGSGSLQGAGPGQRNIRYTDDFGGTSGAGPIVAGAVAAVLSYLKAEGSLPMDSQAMVDLLRSTGTPQADPGSGLIGSLPNVPAAVARLESAKPNLAIHSPTSGSTVAFGSDKRLDLVCDPGNGQELESCFAVDSGPQGQKPLVNGDRLPTEQPGSHTITATVTNRIGVAVTQTVSYTVGPGCLVPGVTLTSVVPRGQKIRILGLADPTLAGTRAIIQRAGRKVATTLVGTDGLIATSVKAKSKKARTKAGYRLVLGRMMSAPVKPNGRLKLLSRRPLASSDEVKLKLRGVKKKGTLILRTAPSCGGKPRTRTVKHDRRGVFKLRLGFSPAAQTYSIRKGGRNIPVPLVLPAERFVFSD